MSKMPAKVNTINRVVTTQQELDAAIAADVQLIVVRGANSDTRLVIDAPSSFSGSFQVEEGFVIARGAVFVTSLNSAKVEAHDKTRITTMGHSTVFCYDHVWAVAYGSATLVRHRGQTGVSVRRFVGSKNTSIVVVG